MCIFNATLKDLQLDVWYLSLDADSGKLASLLQSANDYLTADDLAKARRFSFPYLQRRYMLTHIVLRQLLSQYLHVSPKTIELHYGEYGKPYLCDSQNPALFFNLSHSHELALFAFFKNKQVGIDVEYLRDGVDFLGLAKRFFAPEEYQQLFALDKKELLGAFFRCWTRKEAFVKCMGYGLSRCLKKFVVDIRQEVMQCLLSVGQECRSNFNAPEVLIRSIAVPNAQYVAAVAAEVPWRSLRFFDYLARQM